MRPIMLLAAGLACGLLLGAGAVAAAPSANQLIIPGVAVGGLTIGMDKEAGVIR